MTLTNADIPAMPQDLAGRRGDDPDLQGLTRREWLAGMAMQGLLASGKFQVDGEMSREAWSAADQMLWQQERDADIERYTGQTRGQQ